MPSTRSASLHTFLSLVLLTSLILSGCGFRPGPTGNSSTPTGVIPAVTLSPPAAPSATAEGAKALLVIPGSDPANLPAAAQALRTTLEALAATSGMKVEVRPGLDAADLTSGVKVVVVVSTTGQPGSVDVAGLSGKAPATQFVAIGAGEWQAENNVSVIGGDSQAAQTAFLAGYIAALTTSDWRAGTLSLGDAPGQVVREAFLNGARYVCGICLPKSPPYPGYPVYADAVSPTEWQGAVAELKTKGAKVVYVPPALAAPDVWDALSQAGARLIGATPPTDALITHWIATVGSDPIPALEALWPDLMAGKAGLALNARLTVSQVDNSVLTPGKMRLVEQVVEDLAAGRIGVSASPYPPHGTPPP
ncbi:MAG: hypothetical protein PHQ40_09475 [Anaerolineaceae bacterium]|nr:hypothetical protein [Anaerolineaceae bacterium]